MKRLFPLGLVAIVIASALAIVSPTTAKGQAAGLVSSVLNRMEQNRQSLKNLRAGISMEKYNAQLRDSDRYKGVVLYMPAPGVTLPCALNGAVHNTRFFRLPMASTLCFDRASSRQLWANRKT